MQAKKLGVIRRQKILRSWATAKRRPAEQLGVQPDVGEVLSEGALGIAPDHGDPGGTVPDVKDWVQGLGRVAGEEQKVSHVGQEADRPVAVWGNKEP